MIVGVFWKQIFKDAVVSLWESVLGAAGRTGTPEIWEWFPLIVFHGCADITLPLSVGTDLGAVLPPSGHQQRQEHLTLKLSLLIKNKLRIQTKEILLVLWQHPCLSNSAEVFVSYSVVSKAWKFLRTSCNKLFHLMIFGLVGHFYKRAFDLFEIRHCFVWLNVVEVYFQKYRQEEW